MTTQWQTQDGTIWEEKDGQYSAPSHLDTVSHAEVFRAYGVLTLYDPRENTRQILKAAFKDHYPAWDEAMCVTLANSFEKSLSRLGYTLTQVEGL